MHMQGGSCGFGMRGQKSRSGTGAGSRPGFEGGQTPIYRQMPKLRGIAGGAASPCSVVHALLAPHLLWCAPCWHHVGRLQEGYCRACGGWPEYRALDRHPVIEEHGQGDAGGRCTSRSSHGAQCALSARSAITGQHTIDRSVRMR